MPRASAQTSVYGPMGQHSDVAISPPPQNILGSLLLLKHSTQYCCVRHWRCCAKNEVPEICTLRNVFQVNCSSCCLRVVLGAL